MGSSSVGRSEDAAAAAGVMEKTTTQRTLDMLREEWTRPYREALLELHSAGMALVPHLPPISAAASIRWDEAMSAADELLKGGSADA